MVLYQFLGTGLKRLAASTSCPLKKCPLEPWVAMYEVVSPCQRHGGAVTTETLVSSLSRAQSSCRPPERLS